MSLQISNLATEKQRATLKKYEYQGSGKYAAERLTIAEAADIITELFAEERMMRDELEGDRYEIY
jgi:hypothetical protein